jgi:hypothetical protein
LNDVTFVETSQVWGRTFTDLPGSVADRVTELFRRVVGRAPNAVDLKNTMWFAGGGFKPGVTYGATDDLGFHVAHNPVHVHDIQATILYLLGLDHKRLTYRFAGRDFRLTDVHDEVVRPILA